MSLNQNNLSLNPNLFGSDINGEASPSAEFNLLSLKSLGSINNNMDINPGEGQLDLSVPHMEGDSGKWTSPSSGNRINSLGSDGQICEINNEVVEKKMKSEKLQKSKKLKNR